MVTNTSRALGKRENLRKGMKILSPQAKNGFPKKGETKQKTIMIMGKII